MKIFAYGDSFVAGDQDIPGRTDAILENMEYNRYNISFASIMAKELGAKLINRAISGCSNLVQLDRLWLDLQDISKDDLVLFGLTTPLRDRFMIPHIGPGFLKADRGPALADRSLFGHEPELRIGLIDLYYLLSVLEKIETQFGFNIIKFNAFHNPLQDAIPADREKFKFEKFIGLHQNGNTILDLLNNNWGVVADRMVDHSRWKPTNNLHLFTNKSHPSVEGHKFISEWLLKILRDNHWIDK